MKRKLSFEVAMEALFSSTDMLVERCANDVSCWGYRVKNSVEGGVEYYFGSSPQLDQLMKWSVL